MKGFNSAIKITAARHHNSVVVLGAGVLKTETDRDKTAQRHFRARSACGRSSARTRIRLCTRDTNRIAGIALLVPVKLRFGSNATEQSTPSEIFYLTPTTQSVLVALNGLRAHDSYCAHLDFREILKSFSYKFLLFSYCVSENIITL